MADAIQCCRPMGLFVAHGSAELASESGSSVWDDDGRPAWRVAHMDGLGDESALPMPFARQADAERALQAIQDVFDWTGSRDDIVRSIRRYGWDRLRQTMVEAMQW